MLDACGAAELCRPSRSNAGAAPSQALDVTSTRSSKAPGSPISLSSNPPIRAGDQPQDGQGARLDDPAVAAATGGSGDPVAPMQEHRRRQYGRASSQAAGRATTIHTRSQREDSMTMARLLVFAV